jgi:hypothetical protein
MLSREDCFSKGPANAIAIVQDGIILMALLLFVSAYG